MSDLDVETRRPVKLIEPTGIDLSVVTDGIADAGISASIVSPNVDVQAAIEAITNETSNAPIVSRFVRFAGGLALIPFIVYFGILFALRLVEAGIVFPKGFSPPIIAGIAAVLSINIITGVFALLAVREKAVPRSVPTIADGSSEPTDSARPKTE